FEGLKKTKSSFVSRYLTLKAGDTPDSTLLEDNRQRLVNLEMFSDVKYSLLKDGKGYQVVFEFNELFTFLPILSFGGLREGAFWAQAGFTEANLAGRGQKLTAYYQYYDRHSVAIGTQFPRINGSSWDLNLNFVKWSTLEPLYFAEGVTQYDYDNFTYGATATYHFDYLRRLEFGGAYFTENYRKSVEQFSEVTPGPGQAFRRKLLAKVIFYNNKVNYRNGYLLEGTGHTTVSEYVHSFHTGDAPFFIMFHDFLWFKLFNQKHNFAMRARVGLSTNEESPFAPFVLDSYLNIRGVGNRVDRGTGVIVINTEYRRLLYDTRSLAIQGVAFADTGTWRTPGGTFSDFANSQHFELFAGLGARLIYKKALNTILRFDYGVDLQDHKSHGFVLGVGQYF
ncbi:MAG: hypothetical protein AAFO69_14665, partial [Bacteroidota bacterium]